MTHCVPAVAGQQWVRGAEQTSDEIPMNTRDALHSSVVIYMITSSLCVSLYKRHFLDYKKKKQCLFNQCRVAQGVYITRWDFNEVFFVLCGSQNKYATRWRSNQLTAVRAANAR
jgi:hypothetical protein